MSQVDAGTDDHWDDLRSITSGDGRRFIGIYFSDYNWSGKYGSVAQLVGMGVPQEQAAQLSVNGITYPLQDQWVLIPSEKEAVIDATNTYNTAIAQLADDYNLALVNANGAMQSLSSAWGITYFETTITQLCKWRSVFIGCGSLTAKGYAIVTNYFVDAINLNIIKSKLIK